MNRFHFSDPDMRNLRMFIAIIEYGGPLAAANELNVSLPMLSRSLAALETRFGVRLCNRGRAGFQITPQGREVYAAAMRLIANIGEFEHSIYDVARAVRGKIRIGIIDNMLSNSSASIHRSISRFIRRYPDIFFELSTLQKPTIESSVREGSIDIGITGDPVFFKSLQYVPFSVEQHYLYVASDSLAAQHLGSGTMLADIPYVRRRYKAPAFEEFEKRHGLRATATAGSLETAAILVAAGAGLGILPSHYVNSMPHIGVGVVPLPDTPVTTVLYAVYRNEANDSPIMSAFINSVAPQP